MYISLRDRPTGRAAGTRPFRVPPVVIGLGMVSLLTDIASESVSTILPLYLTSALGLSIVSYGFIDGLYQGVSALVRIAGGWASDSSGHPKWVAFAGYAISCVARFALLFATGFAAITAVISADRIGKGLRTAPRDAMIAASSPAEHQAQAFGVHRTLDTVGAAIGPLLAFGILWWIPDGYHTVMLVSLGFAVLGLALLGLLVQEPAPRPDAPPRRAARAPFSWRDLATPALRRLLFVAGILGLLTVGDGFIYLALLDRGEFAAHWFPLLYVGTNVAFLAFAIPLGRVADRYGRARVLVLGHLALVAAYVCAAVPLSGAPATIGALLMLGVFYAATDGVIAAIAGQLVPPTSQASGIASAQTVVALARLCSSTAFGVLWFVTSPAQALLTFGALLLVAAPLGLRYLAGVDGATSREVAA